jgi:hypothetical protein
MLARRGGIVKSIVFRSQPARRGGTIVHRARTALAWLATSGLVLAIMLTPHTGATQEKVPFVTGVLDLPLSNMYISPRGVLSEDEGLVFQPSLMLSLNFYQADGPINNVTGLVGVWNSIHSKFRGIEADTTVESWFEIDFVTGISVTFLKDWTISLGYEHWLSPIDALAPTDVLTLRLAYTDHFLKGLMPDMPGELSINPYINFFIELRNKAAAPLTVDESFYFELGFTPKYVFAGYPLTLEMPTYFIFPGDHFYSTNSALGVFSTGVKVTAPLTFIDERYGKWSFNAAVKYYHLANDGVVAGNAALSSDRDQVQVIGGITLNF